MYGNLLRYHTMTKNSIIIHFRMDEKYSGDMDTPDCMQFGDCITTKSKKRVTCKKCKRLMKYY